MGQCVTVNVGNEGNDIPNTQAGGTNVNVGNPEKEEDEEEEEEEEPEMCECMEEGNCIPCV